MKRSPVGRSVRGRILLSQIASRDGQRLPSRSPCPRCPAPPPPWHTFQIRAREGVDSSPAFLRASRAPWPSGRCHNGPCCCPGGQRTASRPEASLAPPGVWWSHEPQIPSTSAITRRPSSQSEPDHTHGPSPKPTREPLAPAAPCAHPRMARVHEREAERREGQPLWVKCLHPPRAAAPSNSGLMTVAHGPPGRAVAE